MVPARALPAWNPTALWLMALGAPLSVAVVLLVQPEDQPVPWAWAATGVLLGLSLVGDPRRRRVLCLATAAASGMTAGLCGLTWTVAAAITVSLVVQTLVARRLLARSEAAFGLHGVGDVSRLIGTAAVSSAIGTVLVTGAVALDGGTGPTILALYATTVFLTQACSILNVLPFFVSVVQPLRMMDRGEAATSVGVLLVSTLVIFTVPQLPFLAFALIPSFAWLAFRQDLRWGLLQLVLVGSVATALTLVGAGPVWREIEALGLPTAVVPAVLALFLVDCALVMFPVTVGVAQHRQSAQQAHVEQARLASVVDAVTSVGIIATDSEGRIAMFSAGAEALTGLDASEVVGGGISVLEPLALEVVPGDLVDQASAVSLLGTSVTATPRRLWHVRGPSGARRIAAITVTPIQTLDGTSDGHVLTLEDVTDQQTIHQATVAALAHEKSIVGRLEELDEVKNAFVATVSHELRTPVTSITGYIEMLSDGDAGELSPEQEDLVRRVSRNGRRLQLLVEDLLMVSRIESRSMSLELSTCDVRSIVGDAVATVVGRWADRDIDVQITPGSGRTTAYADAARVERLVSTIVDNALKFTPDGGAVRVGVDDVDGHVEITVADTGVGIPVEQQERIFTPFFRSSNSIALATQGAGMGLTIARGIVDAHRGHIEIVSSPDSGTTARVRLPVGGPQQTLPTSTVGECDELLTGGVTLAAPARVGPTGQAAVSAADHPG